MFWPKAKNYRHPWQLACVAAGLGQFLDTDKHGQKIPKGKRRRYVGKNFYDLKKSLVRDLIRAGVSETVAMTITGHKTRPMFQRYNISSTEDKKNAQRLLESYRETKRG